MKNDDLDSLFEISIVKNFDNLVKWSFRVGLISAVITLVLYFIKVSILIPVLIAIFCFAFAFGFLFFALIPDKISFKRFKRIVHKFGIDEEIKSGNYMTLHDLIFTKEYLLYIGKTRIRRFIIKYNDIVKISSSYAERDDSGNSYNYHERLFIKIIY